MVGCRTKGLSSKMSDIVLVEVMSLAEVRLQEGESIENALRRFKRKVQTEDIIKEVKRHSFYLKPCAKRRVKEALASATIRVQPWWAPRSFAGNISLMYVIPTTVMAESPNPVSSRARNSAVDPHTKALKSENPAYQPL